MVKGINYKSRIISVKIDLFFQEITVKTEFSGMEEITVKTEFSGSNFLLPTFFLTVANGIFRWQICYLLLLISNHDRGGGGVGGRGGG